MTSVRPAARREVAARQHIHPNTVDYRLRRIAALTGLGPADHHGGITLTAALGTPAAHRR